MSSLLDLLVFLAFYCFLFHSTSYVTATSLQQPAVKPSISLSPEAALALNIPVNVEGACNGGRVYTISSASDLGNLANEIECVYAAGFVPTDVPLGPYYGDVILFLNSGMFTPLIQMMWKGKFGTELRCDGKVKRISWNVVGLRSRMPALLYIGDHGLNLSPEEYDDHRGGFILDYTKDFGVECPKRLSGVSDNDFHMDILNNQFPFNQIVDIVRFVGRSEDGSAILLGKTYMRDMFVPEGQAVSIAYWSIRVYDPRICPDFTHGEALPPLARSFTYKRGGLGDFSLRIMPVSRATASPLSVSMRFFEYMDSFRRIFARAAASSMRRGSAKFLHNLERQQALLSALLAHVPQLAVFRPRHVIESLLCSEVPEAEQKEAEQNGCTPYGGGFGHVDSGEGQSVHSPKGFEFTGPVGNEFVPYPSSGSNLRMPSIPSASPEVAAEGHGLTSDAARTLTPESILNSIASPAAPQFVSLAPGSWHVPRKSLKEEALESEAEFSGFQATSIRTTSVVEALISDLRSAARDIFASAGE